MTGFHRALVLPFCIAALNAPAWAQTAGQPAGQGSGPVTELSTNVGAGSGPVRGSVGDPMYDRPVRSGPVRGSVTGDVTSGPVSDISVGGVTADNPMAGGGTVGQSSAGAVKKDLTSPLGEMISQPLRELGPLQQRLRAVQPLPRDQPGPTEEDTPLESTDGADQPEAAVPQQPEPAEDPGEGEAEAATQDEPEDGEDDTPPPAPGVALP